MEVGLRIAFSEHQLLVRPSRKVQERGLGESFVTAFQRA